MALFQGLAIGIALSPVFDNDLAGGIIPSLGRLAMEDGLGNLIEQESGDFILLE